MSVGNRAATCTSCGKRLNRKQWYYRNGKYFCKKRCWVTEQAKQTKGAEGQQGGAEQKAPTKEPAKQAAAES